MAEKIPEKIGNYEIIEVLGRGAMGTVYKARQPGIGRLVALKTINPAILEEADLLKRFHREAQAAGNLQHPNIVTIFELGDSEGVPFIAMEMLEGESLYRIIARREPLPLARKLSIIAQLCRGLDYAHKHGVIHRDIKPANIVLTKEGNTKVVDFGIVHLASTTVTRTGMVIGTVPYMSPQQLNGEHVDARSDIFSVGVVIYEFVSYHKAFDGPNLTAVMLQIVSKEPTPLSQVTPGVPRGLEELVNKCLRKNPEERFQSLEEVGFELDPIVRTVQRDLVREMVKQGQELVEKKEFTRARAVLRNALSLDSSHDLAKSLMAKVNSELKRLETSVKVQQYLEQAEQLLGQGKYTEAIGSLEEVLRLDSQHGQARAMVETARREAARGAEVRKSLKAGQEALKEGDLTLAETLLTTAIELDSRNAEATALLIQVHDARALRERRRQMREAVWYARQMVTQGRYAEAIDQAGKFEQEFPEEPEVLQVLASAKEGLEKRRRAQQEVAAVQALLDNRKYKEAVERAESARFEVPEEAELLTKLYESAKTQYEAAERQRRIEREVASVQELIKAHQNDLAIQRAERLLKDFSDHPEVNRVLALAREEKQLAEQRKVAVLCQSTQILQDQGRFGDAAREAESGLSEFPGSPDLENQLANARKGLEEQGRKEARRQEEARWREEQLRTVAAGSKAEADAGATAIFEAVGEPIGESVPSETPAARPPPLGLALGGEAAPPRAEFSGSATAIIGATSLGSLLPDLTFTASRDESGVRLPAGGEPPVVPASEASATGRVAKPPETEAERRAEPSVYPAGQLQPEPLAPQDAGRPPLATPAVEDGPKGPSLQTVSPAGEASTPAPVAVSSKQEPEPSPGGWRWAFGLLAVMVLAGGGWGAWRYRAHWLASEARFTASPATSSEGGQQPQSAGAPVPAPPATPESNISTPGQNAGGTQPVTSPGAESQAFSPPPAGAEAQLPKPGIKTQTTGVASVRQTEALPPTKVKKAEAPAPNTTVAADQPPPAPAATGDLVVRSLAGYQVYLDGKPTGAIDATGNLYLKAVASGLHKIRLQSGGTQTDEWPVDVAAYGTSFWTYKPGAPASSPEPAPPSPLPSSGSSNGTPDSGGRPTLSGGRTAERQRASNGTPDSSGRPTGAQAVVSFPVIHRHGLGISPGTLLVGNGKIEFRPDNGKDSFAASLGDVSWGSKHEGEFYVRSSGGKELTFRSSSATAILNAMSQAARVQPQPSR
ncbi:MAG: protein kinase domain-containing protein [Terriglobia bacterium]